MTSPGVTDVAIPPGRLSMIQVLQGRHEHHDPGGTGPQSLGLPLPLRRSSLPVILGGREQERAPSTAPPPSSAEATGAHSPTHTTPTRQRPETLSSWPFVWDGPADLLKPTRHQQARRLRAVGRAREVATAWNHVAVDLDPWPSLPFLDRPARVDRPRSPSRLNAPREQRRAPKPAAIMLCSQP